MVDYRQFLAKEESLVLPWLGGAFVEASGRRLRVATQPAAPGWYAVSVKGRVATVRGPAEPGELGALPRVRGWLWAGRLVHEGGRAEPVALLPGDEPPSFAPAVCRRWHSGDLLFEALEFEGEAEAAVRAALADGGGLKAVKGVAAPLRAAYALAVLDRVGRALAILSAPGEVRAHLSAIADGGAPEATRVLRALDAERALARRELAELARQRRDDALLVELAAQRAARGVVPRQAFVQPRGQEDAAVAAADAALTRAGARLESARRVNGSQLEVVFAFMDHRFISLAEADTLQVVDSGICLGHPPSDELLTLDSLPAVIKEAIDTDVLVILRWP